MASKGGRRLPLVVAVVALLTACGAGAQNVEQTAEVAGIAEGAQPVVEATPGPGSDGTSGIGHDGHTGGAGGKGGSASSSSKRDGMGGLTCSSNKVWSRGHDYEAGAFDSPTAPGTARDALKRALRQHGNRVPALKFRRLAGQSPYEYGKQVTFAGVADDGSVQMLVTVEQGSSSKRWLPIGESACG